MKKALKKQKGIKTEAELKKEKLERARETLGVFESQSNPGTYHRVKHTPGSGELDCPCKGFAFKGTCSHIQRVLQANQGGIVMQLERERDALKQKEKAYAKAYGGGRQ